MKIAFVALPRPEDTRSTRIAPPLPLGYVAALLEQQRHIVRIYDLALTRSMPLTTALGPLRAYRPHLIVIATAYPSAAAQVERALDGIDATIVRMGISLREPVPGQAVAQALWRIDDRFKRRDEQSVIFEALLTLDDDLDSLPFPARHLLPLEQYPLFTPKGELQTTILAAQQLTPGTIIPRQSSLVLAELHSVVQEHGIRHFVFPSPALTNDLSALRDLLHRFMAAGLGPCWEATVDHHVLDVDLLRLCRQAGCELLSLEFAAGDVLSHTARAALSEFVAQTHEVGIGIRATIHLEPPYNAIPALIDVSATFGLDDVQFVVDQRVEYEHERVVGDGVTLEDVAEMARSRYRSSRSRQFFIDRFGPQFGPMLWRVGRAGLLGRTWRRYASEGEEGLLAY